MKALLCGQSVPANYQAFFRHGFASMNANTRNAATAAPIPAPAPAVIRVAYSYWTPVLQQGLGQLYSYWNELQNGAQKANHYFYWNNNQQYAYSVVPFQSAYTAAEYVYGSGRYRMAGSRS
jgi:hypothetical protein